MSMCASDPLIFGQRSSGGRKALPLGSARLSAWTVTPLDSVPKLNLENDPYAALLTPPSVTRSVGYRLRFALQAAILAPSVHNTQPWRFRISDSPNPYVDLLMDSERQLPALDPSHRQLVISCGAALTALEIGLMGCGLEPHVELFPAGGAASCLARVTVNDLAAPHQLSRESWLLLARRRTYRGAMSHRMITPFLQDQLTQAAAPSALLHFVPEERWNDIERLITDASRQQAATPAIGEELRTWTRGEERTRDGVPAANWQRTSEQVAKAPVVQRDFAQDRAVPGDWPIPGVEGNPRLAALLTPQDTPTDWIAAGMALMRVALSAESAGLALGYVNQPTEVPGLRTRLAWLLEPDSANFKVPQLVLRFGYPAQGLPPASPRRPLREILIDQRDEASIQDPPAPFDPGT